ncbi:undecaprenyl-diphosphate phosphatase [Clostridium polynesiense]|uniref:undecaprenyl-diphosphate phosphatase n=1 Tax=Clostridium polynesiense TaxID=1325933 RepID=UPI00058DFF5C|nr:undecaprenyl-diphosphate phosphatase [Clostridium polynesiense]
MDFDVFFILKAIVIAIVEGITEFLPISSTGHMILVGHFIGFEGSFEKLFEIVIQFGAILAIVVLFKDKIFNSFKNLSPGEYGFKLWTNIFIAVIPAVVVGLFLHEKVTQTLMRPFPVALSLVIGGLFMIYAEKKFRNKNKILHIEDVSFKNAFFIGLFQILAILLPGFSRSASTIIGSWIIGLSAVTGAEFAFFLALPTVFGASLYALLNIGFVLSVKEIAALIIGFSISFLIALVVVEQFVNYIKYQSLKGFAVYRILLGLLIIILHLFNII